MRRTPFILRFSTAFLALLLFGATLLMSSHSHAASNPEKSETCATCHLLPQGIKLLPSIAAPQATPQILVSQVPILLLVSKSSQEIFYAAIRGPPARS